MNGAVRMLIGAGIVVLLFLLIGLRMNQGLYSPKTTIHTPTGIPTPAEPTPDTRETFCGGIAGMPCPSGFTCELDGNYPDAGGWCVRVSNEPEGKNTSCEDIGGIWSGQYRECTQIDEDACIAIGGTFDACASPCRHETNKEIVCIQMCVAVCRL